MSTFNIGIDCDGVQFNFSKRFSEIMHKLFGTPIVNESEDVVAWHWEEWYASKEQVDVGWKEVLRTPNFWVHLELLPFAHYLMAKFDQHPRINVYFITSRQDTGGVSALHQSIRALRKMGWIDPQVIISFNKGPLVQGLNLDFFIDDRDKNCLEVKQHSPKTRVYLLDKRHNRGFVEGLYDIIRVNTVIEFADDVMNFVV